MLLPVAPSGTGGCVIISPTREILTVITCGWKHCIIRYNVTRARIGRGQDSHKRRDLDLVRWLPSSSYVPLLCVASIDDAGLKPGESLQVRRRNNKPCAGQVFNAKRALIISMVSGSLTPHVTFSQLLDIHTTTELATKSRRPSTVPLAMDDISVTNVVEELIRNLTVISSNGNGQIFDRFLFRECLRCSRTLLLGRPTTAGATSMAARARKVRGLL